VATLAEYDPYMHRGASAFLSALVLVSCGGESVESNFSELSSSIEATTAAPAATTTPPAAGVVGGSIDVGEIKLRIPAQWRGVTAPPEGAAAAVYAPSDNNLVAERLLVATRPLDATATAAELIEQATNDLEDHFVAIAVQTTSQASIGVDRVPSQQIQFTWEQATEAGVGWRWVASADTELIYVTFLADLSEPALYLNLVQEMLDTARIGG
jgi:hypothetical protein